MHSESRPVVDRSERPGAESASGAPLVTIVVITYNRAQLAADCVASVAGQEATFAFEVVVVDDGSTDDTASLIGLLVDRYPGRIRYVRQSNGGVNAARNRGISEARGSFVALLDDDELAPPGHLVRVVGRFDADDRLDGVGGPCRDHGGGVRTCPDCSLASVDVPGEGVREVRRLLGGNMTVRKEVFEKVGPFDASLSGRGDDDEWFFRARSAGLKFVQDPALWVWHRRDHFTLWELCRQAFRQAQAIPAAEAAKGRDYRPTLARLPRVVGHSIVKGCAKGLWLASKDLGAYVAYRRMKGADKRTRMTPGR